MARNRHPFFGKDYLDEFRLNNFFLDKVKVVCYTLITIKKGSYPNEQ
nr:MAG TPA: hypothetical protein [Caudoviricetes sp.]